jgi:membrane-bound lytic murein transglycosylase B
MRLSRLYFLVLIPLVSFATAVSAATDPITEFCASPTAQADSAARQQCNDYAESLTNSNLKKTEKDEAQAAINKINADIKIAEQKIKIQNTIISKLSKDIGTKSQIVSSLETRLRLNTESMANLMRKLSMKDTISFPEMLLGHAQFSDFYTEVDEYITLNKELNVLVDEVRLHRDETQSEKEVLEDRKNRESDAKASIEAEKRLIDRKKVEKSAILALKTTEYNVTQKILSDQKQKVAQIRARLFKFQDGEGIPFGDAYDYAVKAAKLTVVRPAFVLAIITQESSYDSSDSSFGKNIGQCFLRDTTTGAGVGANTGVAKDRVMNPTRDVPIFIELANQLGRDWANTRVSCAFSYGYGGAMGPAQFIPSTWALYGGYPKAPYSYDASKDRVRKIFGLSEPSNPFNAEHAISASSLFLSDLGAGLQTYSAEKNAACRYYSGSKCPSVGYTKKQRDIMAYGTAVANRAVRIQEEMIDPILGR